MKAKLLIVMAMALVLLAASLALADSVDTSIDRQVVREYSGTDPITGGKWVDVIGRVGDKTTDGFDTSKVVVYFTDAGATYCKDLKIELYTNYPSGGHVSHGGDVAADLILSLYGGDNNYAIAMTAHDGLTLGALYAVDTLASSIDRWSGHKGATYGGAWQEPPGDDSALPANVAYTYMTGSPKLDMKATSFKWTEVNTADGKYMVSIFYDEYNVGQDGGRNVLTGFWGTGDCANDGIAFTGKGSAVPLPPTVLLLGSGLVGLACLKVRRKEKGGSRDS